MATIQQNLRQHLFSNGADALIRAFPQPAILFNGVNYSYNGKVWNIQIAWDKNVCDDIQGVFIQVHSRDCIYGYHFACDNKLSKTGVTHIQFRNFSYSENTIEDSKGGEAQQTENVSFAFIEHMSGGRLAPEAEVPKLPLIFSNDAKSWVHYDTFFQAVPQLFPEVEPQQQQPLHFPQQPPAPPQNNEGPNFLRMALPLVILIAGVVVTVKIVQYVRNQLGQMALNNRGTGAVA